MSEAPYYSEPTTGGSKTGMTLGIIGTVVGGLGLCAGLGCVWLGCAWMGYVCFIAALILGIIGLKKGKEDENPQAAKTWSIIAIVLGALTLLLSCSMHVIGTLLLEGDHIQQLFENISGQLQP